MVANFPTEVTRTEIFGMIQITLQNYYRTLYQRLVVYSMHPRATSHSTAIVNNKARDSRTETIIKAYSRGKILAGLYNNSQIYSN